MTDERTFTQEEVNTLLGKVRGETRDRVKKEFDAEITKQKEDAERVKLAENNEFKELAETLGVQVTELETGREQYKEQVGKFQEIMQGVLDSKLENLSDEAKKAVESFPGDVTAKLDWLNENKALFETQGDVIGSPVSRKKSGETRKLSNVHFGGID